MSCCLHIFGNYKFPILKKYLFILAVSGLSCDEQALVELLRVQRPGQNSWISKGAGAWPEEGRN